MRVRRWIGKLFGIVFLLLIVALIYAMLRSDGVINEPQKEVILMPDSEFAENPVLFRAEDGLSLIHISTSRSWSVSSMRRMKSPPSFFAMR